MTKQIIGRVMMAFKGNYDSTKQYDFLDTVTYDGSGYVCLVNGTTVQPSDNSENWQLIAKKGEAPDTSLFALKSELPDLTPYAKKDELPTIPTDLVHSVDLKAVTETANEAKSQSESNAEALASKADKAAIPTSMSWDNITNKPALARLSDIPKMPDLSGYATIASLVNYVKKTDLPDFTQFARISDIPKAVDLSPYATLKALSDYAKKTDLPDTSQFALKTDIPDTSDFAKKEDIPDVSQYALKKDIPSAIDTSNFATKTEVTAAQSTADSANQTARNDATLIKRLSQRVDNLKIPTASDFNQVKTITSGTLADLATTQGSYHYEIECWPSDTPIQEWGLCDVVVGQHYAKQVFTVTGATGDDQGNVYVRVRDYSGQWHEWREITAWN